MQQIAQILLFDGNNKLLIYLRDDKAEIPFPNHWDFFGGHVEAGETPEAALVRELKEELDIELEHWQFFRQYECLLRRCLSEHQIYLYWRDQSSAGEPDALRGTAVDEYRGGRTSRL